MDKVLIYLTSKPTHEYDKALAEGWTIATGMIEGSANWACQYRPGANGRTMVYPADLSAVSGGPQFRQGALDDVSQECLGQRKDPEAVVGGVNVVG
jgi:hypothetical protein